MDLLFCSLIIFVCMSFCVCGGGDVVVVVGDGDGGEKG